MLHNELITENINLEAFWFLINNVGLIEVVIAKCFRYDLNQIPFGPPKLKYHILSKYTNVD